MSVVPSAVHCSDSVDTDRSEECPQSTERARSHDVRFSRQENC